jgi:hypothetical protein
LIPKYYKTPRSLPTLDFNGTRSYIPINDEQNHQSVNMRYDPNYLQVKVSTGVNFAMQKELALETILKLVSSSEIFAQFINEEGLQVLLNNIDIRGIEDLRMRAIEFEQRIKQSQQQKSQQQEQLMKMEMEKLRQEVMKGLKEMMAPAATQVAMEAVKQKAASDAANTAIKERDSDTKFVQAVADINMEEAELEVKQNRTDAENMRTISQIAIDAEKHIMEKQSAKANRKEKSETPEE